MNNFKDYKDFITTIGRRIKERRKELGWSITELSRRAGISKSFLYGIEAGKVNMSVDTLFSLKYALNVSYQYIFSKD
ncbi:MAG: helix-turn-helix domain-containing protein [Oscillospiraceae bacterium]|nr:helix-turn-helix domain-containing protein [Oscillospiraceae bacterium]